MGLLSSILGGVSTVLGGPLGGALIGAGSSLLGGAMDRSAQKKANAANTPAAQVKAWEDAEINPIFGLSSGAFIPQQASSMGDSFARAGAIFGEGLDRNHDAQLAETAVKKENQRLRKELDKLSRPSTPGHLASYGSVLPLPTDRSLQPGPDGFPKVDRQFEVEAGSGGVDKAGNPVTNLSFGGKLWRADRRQSDAEMIETRYGDIAQEVFGFGTLIADTYLNTAPFREDWVMRSEERKTSEQKRAAEFLDVKKRDARDKVTARRSAAGGGALVIAPRNDYKEADTISKLNKRVLSLGRY